MPSFKDVSNVMVWCTLRITQIFKHNNTSNIPTVIRNYSAKCLTTENTSPDDRSQTELVKLQRDKEEGDPFFGGQSNLNEIENNCASKFLDIGNENDSFRYDYDAVHTQNLDDKCKWDSDNDRSESKDNYTVDPSSAFEFVEDEEIAAYITEDWFINNFDLHGELDVSEDRPNAGHDTEQFQLSHSQNMYNTNTNALFNNFAFKMDVPENLTEIRVPVRELSDITFAENEDGEKIVYLTGDTAEIFLVYAIDLQKTVVAKKVKALKFVDVLRETRIQQYLMSGQYVPEVLGLIGIPESQETIILQEFCAQGKEFSSFCIPVHKLIKSKKEAKIRNRYNQAPHLTQDTNGKVTTSQLDITNESQEVTPFPARDQKASTNRRA